MKTLYVSDLDGTLLNSKTSVSRTSANILNNAIADGALFSVATARTPATLAILLKDIDIQLPMVVMTGAALWHRESNTYSEVCYFNADTIKEIRSIYKDLRVPTFIYTLRDGVQHIYHSGPLSEIEREFVAQRLSSPYKVFHLHDKTLADSPHDGRNEILSDRNPRIPDFIDNAVLMFGMQPEKKSRPVFDRLSLIPDINPMFYFDPNYKDLAMIEAFPKSATKANAVKKLARICGADRIVAFGDNRNDIPMLKAADIAVATANAIDEVKDIADIVIGSNNEDSVARFIALDHAENHSL